MTQSVRAGCINHPGVEAVIRCKQCGKPACNACCVKGPTGAFCSDACKQKHEHFVNRAKNMDAPKDGNTFYRMRKFVIRTLIAVVVLAAVCFATYYFQLDSIPVLPDIGARIGGLLGL